MKKKLILGVVAAIFAAITVVNINLAMKAYNGDVSLESIAVMAQASTDETNTLPEVKIICGLTCGKCWVFAGTWEGEYYTKCRATGSQSDFCC